MSADLGCENVDHSHAAFHKSPVLVDLPFYTLEDEVFGGSVWRSLSGEYCWENLTEVVEV